MQHQNLPRCHTSTNIITNMPLAVKHNELTFYKQPFDTINSAIILCLISKRTHKKKGDLSNRGALYMSLLSSTMTRDFGTTLRIVWKGLGGDHVEWEMIIQSLNIFLGKGSASVSGLDHQNNRPTLSVAIN